MSEEFARRKTGTLLLTLISETMQNNLSISSFFVYVFCVSSIISRILCFYACGFLSFDSGLHQYFWGHMGSAEV